MSALGQKRTLNKHAYRLMGVYAPMEKYHSLITGCFLLSVFDPENSRHAHISVILLSLL